MVEGAKLLGEARAAGLPIEAVFIDPAAGPAEVELAKECAATGTNVFELQPGVLARACDTVTPQKVAAIVGAAGADLAGLRDRHLDLIVICVDVRDPGNLGTIIRSAGAAGAQAVLCCAGTADLYNPKTVRASAGMLFHLPVVAAGDPIETLDEVARWGLHRWGTSARDGADYSQADLSVPTALVLGNEAHGLSGSAGLDDHLDGTLCVPMAPPAESLNVAATAAVLCFEASRQRRVKGRKPRDGADNSV